MKVSVVKPSVSVPGKQHQMEKKDPSLGGKVVIA